MRVRNHANPLNYTERKEKLNLSSVFACDSEVLDIEVGFGRGVFLRDYVSRYPDRRVIGIEVRKQMVEILQDRVAALDVKNLCLLHGTAEICLADMIDDGVVDKIFVFHPDPWLKKRHHKRRVIRPEFLDLCAKKLKQGGCVYVSTDVESLWADMQETFSLDNRFLAYDDTEFWDNYVSHWDSFSRVDERVLNRGAFQLQ